MKFVDREATSFHLGWRRLYRKTSLHAQPLTTATVTMRYGHLSL